MSSSAWEDQDTLVGASKLLKDLLMGLRAQSKGVVSGLHSEVLDVTRKIPLPEGDAPRRLNLRLSFQMAYLYYYLPLPVGIMKISFEPRHLFLGEI